MSCPTRAFGSRHCDARAARRRPRSGYAVLSLRASRQPVIPRGNSPKDGTIRRKWENITEKVTKLKHQELFTATEGNCMCLLLPLLKRTHARHHKRQEHLRSGTSPM